MDQIETFIRKLCAEGDLSVLTKKIIRKQYKDHYHKMTITREEKDRIKKVLDTVLQEIADQGRDNAASTATTENVNCSTTEHGKENLHADHSSNVSPVVHQNTHKAPRTDLGLSSFSHTYHRHIKVSMDKNRNDQSALPFKGKAPTHCHRESVGVEEAASQHQNSPLRQLSADSMSNNSPSLGRDLVPMESAVGDDGGVDSHKTTICSKRGVREITTAGFTVGSKCPKSVFGNSCVVEPRSADQSRDLCEDEVIVSPAQSDSSQSSKCNLEKELTAKKTVARGPAVNGCSDNEPQPKVSPRKRRRTATKMYTVQDAVSMIFQSSESQTLNLNTEDLSPLSEEEELPPHLEHSSGHVQSSKVCMDAKNAASDRNRRMDMDSDDSLDDRLVIDESPTREKGGSLNIDRHSGTSKRLKETLPSDTDGVDSKERQFTSCKRKSKESKVDYDTSLDRILQTGFSSHAFFGKKACSVESGNKRKPLKLSDTPALVDEDSDSDDMLLSEVKKRSDIMQPPDSMESTKSKYENDKRVKTKLKDENVPNGQRKKGTRQKQLQDVPLKSKTKTKRESKTRHIKRADMKKQNQSSDDYSDGDDLPLNCLQNKSKNRNSDTEAESVAIISCPQSDSVEAESSPYRQKNSKIPIKGIPSLSDICNTELGGKGAPLIFSPPVSPEAKISSKQHKGKAKKTKKIPQNKTNFTALKSSSNASSESTDNDSFCSERKTTTLKLKLNTKILSHDPKDSSVHSSSDSTEGGGLGNRLCVKRKLNGGRLLLNKNINSRLRVTHGESRHSLTDNSMREECSALRHVDFHSEYDDFENDQWSAVPYKGEKLMFPVIKLHDVNQTCVPSPTKSSDSKKERNIFSALECERREKQAHESVITSSKSSSLSNCLSLSTKENSSLIDSAEINDIQDSFKLTSLDKSRTVLKKQRSEGKGIPKLRTTLKLRKQVSPDKGTTSSELEEWTVIHEDDIDWSGDENVCALEASPRKGDCIKKSKLKKKKGMPASSSSDDDEPLKKRSRVVARKTADNSSDLSVDDASPIKVKRPKKRAKLHLDSSSEDEADLPLNGKASPVANMNTRDESDETSTKSTPEKIKKLEKQEDQVQDVDSSDEDDLPLEPRTNTDAGSEDEEKEKIDDNVDDDEVDGSLHHVSSNDSTPLKVKKSKKAANLDVIASDSDSTPIKKTDSQSNGCESDLDTSSLSSEDENEVPDPVKHTGSIKSTLKKAEPLKQSKPLVKTKGKVSQEKASKSESSNESRHLERLRKICRQVGIFVRSDVHFVGCTTDKEKIGRLKEALWKAGMKGQPSFSKVESVNLKKEAETLDMSNIIETSGRPKRQPRGVFERTNSPKKSLTPIKEQFSRIKDIISESDSD